MTVEEFLENGAQAISILGPKPKTLHEQQRATALARLGGTTMPADPVKLAEWHHKTAVRQGWKQERESGSDDE